MKPSLVSLFLSCGWLLVWTARAEPPQASGGASAPPALVVTRFWHPWRTMDWPYKFFMFNLLASDDGGVWLEGSNPGGPFSLFRVSLPDFATQVIPLPAGRHTQTLAVTPGALYMAWDAHGNDHAAGGEHQLARYDLKTAQWSANDLPAYSNAYLYNLDSSLYLVLQDRHAAGESAILCCDREHDRLTVLSSTRRRPGQNQFDDRAGLLDARIFLGPGRRPCVNTSQEGTFYIQEAAGPWPQVADDPLPGMSTTTLGKTLVFGRRDEVTLLDPDRPAPELLLAPAGNDRALWDLPKDEKVWYSQVCLHDDCLFILVKPKTRGGPYDLLCYQRGAGREPRHIPLEFRLDEPSRGRLSVKPEAAPSTWEFGQIEHPDTTVYPDDFVWFQAVRQGLYFHSFNVGFWLLPYEEIDAYLEGARP